MIRGAKPSDLDRLIEIERACFQLPRYEPMSRRQFLRHLTSPKAVLIVAVDAADSPVGYALGFLHAGRGSLRFYSLAVLPDAQRGEVGKLLFERIEHEAFSRNLDVQCEVRADNEKLKKRYDMLGYRAYKTVDNYYPDGAACVKYRRRKP